MILGPKHASVVVDLACRSALAGKSVAHLTCPADIQDQAWSDETASMMFLKGHTSASWRPPINVPQRETLETAAALLNSGKKTAILAGAGALGAADELEEAAELLAGPIIKPLLGKACVPDDSPYTTGGIGLLGTRPSQDALEHCDTLLMVGTSFPYIEFYPKPGDVKAIQIELDPKRIGLRYPIEVGLIGDSANTLAAINKLLKRKSDRTFLQKAQKGMREWNKLMNER